jgi:uncharacterized repeat protein (TIGR02543 family)
LLNITWFRVITAVNSVSNTITIDSGITSQIDITNGYATALIESVTLTNMNNNIGIEDLILMSDYNRNVKDANGYYVDENHANIAIDFNARNCWARRVTGFFYWRSMVSCRWFAHNITIEDCGMLDGVSTDTPKTHAGAREYLFTSAAPNVLFQRCYGRNGRHTFILNQPDATGNVFLDCYADKEHLASEPHQVWSHGNMYDNCRTDGQFKLNSAGASAHGQRAANCMLWNITSNNKRYWEPDIYLDKPRLGLGQQWAIGIINNGTGLGIATPSPESGGWGEAATVESVGSFVEPRSLYLGQLKDRLGQSAVDNIVSPEQRISCQAVWNKMTNQYQSIPEFGDPKNLSWLPQSTNPPAITAHPASVTVTNGATAMFSVTASGTEPLAYQWYKNGAVIGGATALSYTTPATTPADNNAQFKVTVTNLYGAVTSSVAILTGNFGQPMPITVTYNGNTSDSGSVPVDGSTYTNGATVTVLGNPGNLGKTGHTFTNWNTAALGSGTSYAPAATFNITASTTLYAQWTPFTYTVSYAANGADSGTAPGNQTKTHGVTLTLASNSGNLVKSGYIFAGWNTATNGSGTSYPAGGSYTNNSGVTLYAMWVAPLYWDNTGGTANDWGSVANWSTVVGGGTAPAAIPGASDVATFSATPIQGTLQTNINLNADRSVLGLNVLSGVTSNITLLGGGTDRTLTLGALGIVNAGSGQVTIGSSTAGQRVNITLAGSQSCANNGTAYVLINNTVSGSGNPTLTNNGTGSNYIQFQTAITNSVTKVVQDSATSPLRLRDARNAFGSLEVKKGLVRCANAQGTTGPGPLGAGTVTLGNGTDSATVYHADNSSYSYTNSFILATGAGTLTIGILGNTAGTVYTATFTGGVTGNNSLTLENYDDEKLTFSTGALNNSGTITHIGAGTGDLTINSVIGANVTGVIQNSATSRMVLAGANTYTGNTTVSLGTLVLTNNARFATNSTVTIASGAKLQLDFAATNVVAGLVTNGVSLSAGVYSSNNVAPFITGPGRLQVVAQQTYAVTYDGNGHTSGSAPANQTKVQDVTLTLASNSSNLEKAGNIFAGWNTQADGNGTDYAEGATYTANAAVTLYAKWTADTYMISFDGQGGTDPSPADKSVTFDSTYGALATTTRTGYTFAGWWTGAGGTGSEITAASTVANASDHTLYAKWTANPGPSGPGTITNSYNSGTSTLSLSWPAGQGWRLQQQTNSLSTGISTNWVYVTDGSVSSTNILVNPTRPAVFYRLTYP